jgi:diguanylate cyclase (GGDEF)-like protein
MIRIYTTNNTLAQHIAGQAASKGFAFEQTQRIDGGELAASIDGLSVLIFDLTSALLSAGDVVGVLDTMDSERVPPVLYLLANPADIDIITQAGSIINQDFAFIPGDQDTIIRRLEVLTILGSRRKLTMETAITDRLTGLYNRKYFLRRLEEELYRSTRYGYKLGVLLADVDFKGRDGRLPEETGTVVMKRIADFLRDRLRKTDIVARYSWDVFAFLLPDIGYDDSLAVAEDLKRKLDRLPLRAEDVALTLSAAIGHACCPLGGLDSAVDVLTALEDCCLRAKQQPDSGVLSCSAAESTQQ